MTDRCLGIWYLQWPGWSWIMVAMRGPDGTLYGTCRIRCPNGQITTQSLGPRAATGPDATAIDNLRKVAAESASQFLPKFGLTLTSPGVLLDEVIVCGDAAKAQRLLRCKSWIIDDRILAPEDAN
jgi:hypothetical protein